MHKLMSCAKIATCRMYLYDREDKMQDAILDVLEKGYQDAPQALVVAIMRNKIKDLIKRDSKKKRSGNMVYDFDIMIYDEFEIFELFKNFKYRNYLIIKGIVHSSAKDVSNSLSMPYKTVLSIFHAIKRELRRNDKDSIGISRGNFTEYPQAIQNRPFRD